MQKENIILDTDISNEVDDQFALCYLIKSIENFNLQAITIAPFSKSGYANTNSTSEGTDLSYNTACKILDLLNEPTYKDIIYKGATKYFWESKKTNKATEKIIEIAKKNDKTTIIAIGAITNVALALHYAPDIASKLNIVWLGGNSFLSELNDEFNFRQDVEAVRKVFNSGAKLTVIPCKNVASQLGTTIYELEHYLKDVGEIGEYLCDIFSKCKKSFEKSEFDKVGQSKTLWDISAIAYIINSEWFTTKEISIPEILDNTAYKLINNNDKVTFVNNLNRHKIYQDFFVKMGYKIKT